MHSLVRYHSNIKFISPHHREISSILLMMYCQIVVVPDDVAVNKLPQITGLLAYQKDSEVLRLMKNGTWKEIAEKEVMRYF